MFHKKQESPKLATSISFSCQRPRPREMRVQGSGEEGTAATKLLRFPWSTADPSRLSRGGQRVSGLPEIRERRRERRGAKLGKLKGGAGEKRAAETGRAGRYDWTYSSGGPRSITTYLPGRGTAAARVALPLRLRAPASGLGAAGAPPLGGGWRPRRLRVE